MFKPVIIGAGLPAWSLLQSTLSDQKRTFGQSREIKSDVEYLKARLPAVSGASDIIGDRRLMRVVLGAYDLSGDIDNRFFIRKIMEGGVTDRTSLANKLSDRRYRQLATDFDFSATTRTLSDQLIATTTRRFQDKSFEIAVGEQDQDMRLALGFQSGLEDIAIKAGTNTSAWYQILATPSVRTVIDTALSLPKEFQNLDIDDQLDRIMERASRQFGTNEVLSLISERQSDEIVQRFLVKKQAATLSAVSPLQTALVLLQSAT